ncbi:preATP grasp domain-containing protein [Streptomyces sp. LZ34]
MTRVLIANEFNEDRAGIADAKRKKTAWWTQRMLWLVRDGDVLVMAVEPDEEYLGYVLALTGTRRSTVRVVVPPPGALGTGVLTPDRLQNPEFHDALRTALGGRVVDSVISLHPDTSIAALARALGVAEALPGHGFLEQGGGRLVNSKAVFRALAGGVGAPVPDGGVCTDRAGAEEVIWRILGDGHPVMLKHDLRAGGRGNEILSPVEGTVPVGAQHAVVVADREALRSYLARRWDWLTSHGQSPAVVERYFPDSHAVFAEFEIGADGPVFAGQGEMMSAPLAAAQVIPAPCLTPGLLAELTDGARRLCEPLHAMGYRGMLSADAILTPGGDILFTEYNGRITGSTPIYRVIGEHLVGPDHMTTRSLFDHDGWPVPSFREALDTLTDAGLAYDPATRTGVVLVMPYNAGNSSIRYCVVAETFDAALKCRQVVASLFED